MAGKKGTMDYSNFTKEELIVKYEELLQQCNETKEEPPPPVPGMNSFSFLVDILNSGALFVNTKGKIVEVNSVMLGILGSPSKDATQKINILTFPPLVQSGYSEKVRTCIETGEPLFGEQSYISKWGKEIVGRYYMSPVKESEKVVGVFINHTDVTEERKVQKELKESEASYRGLFNSATDAIFIHDLNGVFIEVNDSVEKMYGYPKDYFIGKNVEDFSAPGKSNLDEVHEAIKEISEGDNLLRGGLLWGRRANGAIFPQNVRAVKARYLGNDVILSFATDISKLIAQEEELREAKAKAEENDHLKSAFLANMSHEIRTPMNGILGFAELLDLPDLTKKEQQEYVEIIQKSGVRMLNILNDLIDISKIEAGQMELLLSMVNIPELIQDVYNFFVPEAKAEGLELNYWIRLDGDERVVKTDQAKVEALLTNLVKNAIKYSQTGKIEIGCHRKGDVIEFEVKDQGIGIAAEKLNEVFIRFVQNEISPTMVRQGAGLGLAIAKGYVEIIGGEIWVESEEGIGSTFYFTIPCS